MKNKRAKTQVFERLSTSVTKYVGSTPAFTTAMAIVISWLITGPAFNFSNSWQLVINTGTTIVTFLMVFLIQRSQNKESLAIQIKLNELIASSKLASNRLIDIEDLSEEDLVTLEKYYAHLVIMSRKEKNMHQSHSIDEASRMHESKESSKKIRNTHPDDKDQ